MPFQLLGEMTQCGIHYNSKRKHNPLNTWSKKAPISGVRGSRTEDDSWRINLSLLDRCNCVSGIMEKNGIQAEISKAQKVTEKGYRMVVHHQLVVFPSVSPNPCLSPPQLSDRGIHWRSRSPNGVSSLCCSSWKSLVTLQLWSTLWPLLYPHCLHLAALDGPWEIQPL